MINEDALKKIEQLEKTYENNWGLVHNNSHFLIYFTKHLANTKRFTIKNV